MFRKKKYKRRCMKKCFQYVGASYKIITNIDIGECPHNQMCHVNSVQYAKKHKGAKIYGCYRVDSENQVSAHFINKKRGKYVETTKGWVGPHSYDYYIVKEFKILEFEFEKVGEPLYNLKKHMFNVGFTNRFLNRIYRFKALDLF